MKQALDSIPKQDCLAEVQFCPAKVFDDVKAVLLREEEKFVEAQTRHQEENCAYRSLGWGQMAVIPLPRLDLDSGRIERDIRGSLMQTPQFLID